jgi:hypothetical protein
VSAPPPKEKSSTTRTEKPHSGYLTLHSPFFMDIGARLRTSSSKQTTVNISRDFISLKRMGFVIVLSG